MFEWNQSRSGVLKGRFWGSIWCKTSEFTKSALRGGSWANIGSPRASKVVRKEEESGVQTTTCIFSLDFGLEVFTVVVPGRTLPYPHQQKREVVVRFRCLVLNVGG